MVIIHFRFLHPQFRHPLILLNHVKCQMPRFWQLLKIMPVVQAWQKRQAMMALEIMGSEGYLINQFLSSHVNKRTDRLGWRY